MRKKILFIAILLLVRAVFGLFETGGTGEAEYLLPVGSQGIAMGDFLIDSSDCSVMKYNPAAMASIKGLAFMLSYVPELMPDTGYVSAGVSFYNKIIPVGVLYNQVFVYDIKEYGFSPISQGDENQFNFSGTLTFARHILFGFYAGANININIIKSGNEITVLTPGGDLYVSYIAPNPFESIVKYKFMKVIDNFKFFFGIKNLIPAFNLKNGKTEYSPFIFTSAFGYIFRLPKKVGTVYFQTGVTFNKQILSLGIGMEIVLINHFILRGGYNLITNAGSAGVGFEFKGIGIDYTFVPSPVNMAHYITVRAKLDFFYKSL